MIVRLCTATLACGVLVLASSGCEKKTASQQNTSSAGAVRVAITIDSTGFNPPVVQATAGQPLTLVFTRVTDQTCATSIQIPSMDVTQAIPLNAPTEVTVTPKKSGEVPFACGMNMITGVIDVQ